MSLSEALDVLVRPARRIGQEEVISGCRTCVRRPSEL
jgi:hypothetical protein